MLKKEIITTEGIGALKDCLSMIPSLRVETIELLTGQSGPDYRIKICGIGFVQFIYVETKVLGTPKSARDAVNSLSVFLRDEPNGYGVLLAPYISPGSAKICKEEGIGYLDLSGNCWITFQQVFISRDNMPNKYPFKSGLASLYSPKSERILRVLLTFPDRSWKTIELAKEAQVSLGMITHVRRRLLEEEWIRTTTDGFFLSQPEKLLLDWSRNYSIFQNKIFEFYSMKSYSDIELDIAKVCEEIKIPYALTGFSASARLAPVVRGQRSMIFITRGMELVANQIGLKSVDSGANVFLIQPYDEGVLWNSKIMNGIQIVTPIQVYLDLKKFPGRGEEAAEFLFKEVIKKSWL